MSAEADAARKSRWLGLDSARRVRERLSNVLRRHGLVAFFTLQVIGLTFLQKFAIQFDATIFGFYISVGAVQLALPIFYLGLLGLFAFARPKVDIIRVALFSIFIVSVVISLALQPNFYSQSSVLLMIACYLPFILIVEISASTYRKMLNVYLNVMIIMGAIVLAQQVVQNIWNWRVWPNLNELVSPNFLLPSFNYIQPIIYGSNLMKPHGIFFLEVSTVSQFVAVAFAIEMIYFRRLWRLIYYVIVLLATFAGTGPLLLLLCAPVLVAKLSWRTLLVVVLIFGVGYVAADKLHWYQQIHGRLTEYETTNSSAHLRFVDPLEDLVSAVSRPQGLVTGIGPGNTAKDDGTVSWAATKVAVEYGLLSLVTFSMFVGYVIFRSAPSQRLAFVLVVFFNFMGGGIVIPIYPVMIFLMGGLFRFDGSDRRRRQRSSNIFDSILSSMQIRRKFVN